MEVFTSSQNYQRSDSDSSKEAGNSEKEKETFLEEFFILGVLGFIEFFSLDCSIQFNCQST